MKEAATRWDLYERRQKCTTTDKCGEHEEHAQYPAALVQTLLPPLLNFHTVVQETSM